MLRSVMLAVVVFALRIAVAAPPTTVPAGMVWIPPGTFMMGCDDARTPDAQPLHPVTLDAFYIDATPVTNAEFERFVDATHYVTVAERKPDPKDYPGVPPDKLVAGSAVFVQPP